MPSRPAAKAGSWYSANPATLTHELARYLAAAETSGAAPARAAVVPHAGLAFSGPNAARVYAWLQAANPEVETFVIFGAVHTTTLTRPAVWTSGVWQTPLGDIQVDEELAAAFVKAGVGEDDATPHYDDNAIELQTPFLRHCFPAAKLVAVATPPAAGAVEAGTAAWEICARAGRRVIALGSTDLTHYGRSFAFTPAGVGEKALAWAKANDRQLLDLMAKLAAEEVVPAAKQAHSACGAGAAAATVAFARAAGCREGKLLGHTTSHEVRPEGEAAHFVGYGAMVFLA